MTRCRAKLGPLHARLSPPQPWTSSSGSPVPVSLSQIGTRWASTFTAMDGSIVNVFYTESGQDLDEIFERTEGLARGRSEPRRPSDGEGRRRDRRCFGDDRVAGPRGQLPGRRDHPGPGDAGPSNNSTTSIERAGTCPRRRWPRTVAFIIRDLVGPLFAYIGQGVEQQTTAEGRLCLVCTHNGDADRELELIELMREQQAEAVVLVGGGVRSAANLERMTQLARRWTGPAPGWCSVAARRSARTYRRPSSSTTTRAARSPRPTT